VGAGRVCLELGCGLGLLGVCLSRIGTARTILTDGDVAALENCIYNLRMNGVFEQSEEGDMERDCRPTVEVGP
jgi:ribosomal protein L11 methylase PrmA